MKKSAKKEVRARPVRAKENAADMEPEGIPAAPRYEPSNLIDISEIERRISGIEGKISKKMVYAGVALVMIILLLSCVAYFEIKNEKEKDKLESRILGMEHAVNGTPIMDAREAINEAIASGTQPVTKDEVLYGKGKDYVCTIETPLGIITLKKRDDLMRQEMVREKIYNISVIFIGDHLHIYHPLQKTWVRFDYEPQGAISARSYTYSSFTLKELEGIDGEKWMCIQMDLPEDEFSLGNIPVFDMSEYLRKTSFG